MRKLYNKLNEINPQKLQIEHTPQKKLDQKKPSKGAFTLGVTRDFSVESRKQHSVNHLGLKPSYHENFMLNLHSLNIKQSPIYHCMPPGMPPRFSFNTDLTSSVNAPL